MTQEVIITYETLFEILRREKFKEEIQKLPDNFIENTIKYLQEKQEILTSQQQKQSIFSSESTKTQKQLENTKKLLKELYEKRESKIIQLALIASRIKEEQDLSNILPSEKILFLSIREVLDKAKNDLLINLLEAKNPQIKEIKQVDQLKLKMVKFINPLPQFLGTDQKIYGPFIENDIANLPSEIAELLIKNKRAELFT